MVERGSQDSLGRHHLPFSRADAKWKSWACGRINANPILLSPCKNLCSTFSIVRIPGQGEGRKRKGTESGLASWKPDWLKRKHPSRRVDPYSGCRSGGGPPNIMLMHPDNKIKSPDQLNLSRVRTGIKLFHTVTSPTRERKQ